MKDIKEFFSLILAVMATIMIIVGSVKNKDVVMILGGMTMIMSYMEAMLHELRRRK